MSFLDYKNDSNEMFLVQISLLRLDCNQIGFYKVKSGAFLNSVLPVTCHLYCLANQPCLTHAKLVLHFSPWLAGPFQFETKL